MCGCETPVKWARPRSVNWPERTLWRRYATSLLCNEVKTRTRSSSLYFLLKYI